MLRHLRTHNRTIMAVGGTLLLVSWALGGALSNLSSNAARSGAGWATIGPSNTKITATDLAQVQEELAVLERFGDRLLNNLGAAHDPVHWYLLTREASEAGLVGGLGDGRLRAEERAIAENAQSQPGADGKTPPQIDGTMVVRALMMSSHASEKAVLTTLAKVNGVYRLLGLYSSMPRFSDARLRHAAARELTSVACDVVVLDARTLTLPEVGEPSPPELDEQLKKYGDKKPGEGDFGFGYRLPDRVKVEWIEIPLANVQAVIEASSSLDTLTLKKKFAENPAKFGVTDTSIDALSIFPAYEASVRKTVLEELVTARMADVTKFTSDHLALATRGLAKDGGYFKLPEDWASKKPDFLALCNQLVAEFKIDTPLYGSTGGQWNAADDLKKISNLGTATTTKFGARSMSFTDLIAQTKELGHGNDTVPIQKDVASPPLTATNRSVFFFRVIDVDPSRAPTSVAEAGESLVRDVKAEDRYAAMKAAQAEILALAGTDGMRAVADRYGAKLEFQPRIALSHPMMLGRGQRMTSPLPIIGTHTATVEGIVDFAFKLPLDKPIAVADFPGGERSHLPPREHRGDEDMTRMNRRLALGAGATAFTAAAMVPARAQTSVVVVAA